MLNEALVKVDTPLAITTTHMGADGRFVSAWVNFPLDSSSSNEEVNIPPIEKIIAFI